MSLNELLRNLGTSRAVWVVPPSEPHNTSQLFITFRLTEAHTFTSFTLLIWKLFSRFQEENSWKLQVVQYNTMHFSLYKNKIYMKNMRFMQGRPSSISSEQLAVVWVGCISGLSFIFHIPRWWRQRRDPRSGSSAEREVTMSWQLFQ